MPDRVLAAVSTGPGVTELREMAGIRGTDVKTTRSHLAPLR
jgi:hypothetical protein